VQTLDVPAPERDELRSVAQVAIPPIPDRARRNLPSRAIAATY